jgi:hypothetical protein
MCFRRRCSSFSGSGSNQARVTSELSSRTRMFVETAVKGAGAQKAGIKILLRVGSMVRRKIRFR